MSKQKHTHNSLLPIAFYKKTELKSAHRAVFTTKNVFFKTENYPVEAFIKPISKIL